MRSLTMLALAIALALPSVLSACPGTEAGVSPYAARKVSIAISEQRRGLEIDSTVSGCPGLVMLHQQALVRVVDDARAGTVTDGPFAISGLTYRVTPTDTGAVLRVSGPADVLAAFRAVLEDEQAAKSAGAAATSGSCGGCHSGDPGVLYFGAPADGAGATRL